MFLFSLSFLFGIVEFYLDCVHNGDKNELYQKAALPAVLDMKIIDLWKVANTENFRNALFKSVKPLLRLFNLRIPKHMKKRSKKHGKLLQDKVLF